MARTRTRKVRPRDNPRAKRIFYIAVAFLLWAQIIAVAAVIDQVIRKGISSVNWPAVTLEFTIFISFAVGTYAIWAARPPFHYFVFFGAVLNIIFSLILMYAGSASTAFLQFLVSLLVLYLGLRYPVEFSQDEATFTTR